MYKILDSPKQDHDVVNKIYVDNTVNYLLGIIANLQEQIDEITGVVKVKEIVITGPDSIILE